MSVSPPGPTSIAVSVPWGVSTASELAPPSFAITDVNERCQEPVGVCVRALQLGEEPTAAYSINVASG